MIKFADWLPDQAAYENPGSTVASNVVPTAKGFRPFRGLAPLSGAATAYLRGIHATRDSSDNVSVFAGDATKLYKMNNGTFALADISAGGGYSLTADEQWDFVEFGTDIIAAGDRGIALQKFAVGASAFAAVSGAPGARHLAVVKDFVVTGNIEYGGSTYRNSVRWSQINDANTWTIGTNQADVQAIADAGAITGLVGGETGVVLLEKAIVRMQYVGSPLIFSFEKVETGHGCNYPNSVASLGPNQVFYLSDRGFQMFDGQRSQPIGSEKVDRFFFGDMKDAFRDRLSVAIDPENSIVCWSYASIASSGAPDKLMVYNYALGKWSLISLAHEGLGTIYLPGQTLESLDNISTNIDTLGTSLDDRAFVGGNFQLAASKDNKIHTVSGEALDAILETTEFEPAKMRQSMIKSVTPYVTAQDGNPTVTAQVGSRVNQQANVTFSTASSINAANFAPTRATGRYHRVRLNISGEWRFAQGVDVETTAMGRR